MLGRLAGQSRLVLLLGTLCFSLSVSAHAKPKVDVYVDDAHEMSDESNADVFNKLGIVSDSKELDAFREVSKSYSPDIPVDVLSEYYDKIGPHQILNVIEEDKFCHSKGHNVGRVIYQKTKDLRQSVQTCQKRCSFGCFHGVLMGLFSSEKNENMHISTELMTQKINTICDDPALEINNKKTGSGCYHGVGHAAMFIANYDIDKAIKICNSFDEKVEQYFCATGAYMERAMVHADTDKTKFYPCDTHKSYPAACYRYKIKKVFKKKSYKHAQKACDAMTDKQQRLGCFHGVGFTYWKKIYRDPSMLNKICKLGNENEQRICIEGAAGVVRVKSRDKQLAACKTVAIKSLQVACVQARNQGMSKDMSLYHYIDTKT